MRRGVGSPAGLSGFRERLGKFRRLWSHIFHMDVTNLWPVLGVVLLALGTAEASSRPFVLVRPAWPLAIGLSTVFEVIWRWPYFSAMPPSGISICDRAPGRFLPPMSTRSLGKAVSPDFS